MRNSRPFVMRVLEDDMDDTESEGEEGHGRNLVAVKRFHCDELYLRYTITHPFYFFNLFLLIFFKVKLYGFILQLS